MMLKQRMEPLHEIPITSESGMVRARDEFMYVSPIRFVPNPTGSRLQRVIRVTNTKVETNVSKLGWYHGKTSRPLLG